MSSAFPGSRLVRRFIAPPYFWFVVQWLSLRFLMWYHFHDCDYQYSGGLTCLDVGVNYFTCIHCGRKIHHYWFA